VTSSSPGRHGISSALSLRIRLKFGPSKIAYPLPLIYPLIIDPGPDDIDSFDTDSLIKWYMYVVRCHCMATLACIDV
jgi:hypothetical protein